MKRYSRQTILEEIGEKGQASLSRARVLVIGAGGLGCPVLSYLTAAGVGHIGIADFDTVDITNLQRQVLFNEAQTDMLKIDAAHQALSSLNNDVKIQSYSDGLTAKNAEALFKQYDIIIDGTDNFAAKYLINDAGVKFNKPVIYGAINKFEGQVSVFDARHGPCYRCLYPSAPKHHIPNCAEAGVIGAVAGIVGVTQAMQAIMLIINHTSFAPLIGKFWRIDTRTMRSQILELPKNPHCPVCSKEKQEIKLNYTQPICETIPQISIEDTKAAKTALIVDVREQEEWDSGHIDGAQLIPLSLLLKGDMPDLPKDQDIIFYCRSGRRSQDAAQLYKVKGYNNISNMTGGYLEWIATDHQ